MGALTGTYTAPILDLDMPQWNGKRPPSWHIWARHGLPMGIDLDLAELCPELPAAQADSIRLQHQLEGAIDIHGVQQGVAAFLADASHLDDLLDRRALIIFLAHLSNLDVLPQLPLPEDLYGAGPKPRRRLLRPLEFAMLRAAARDSRRAALLRLLAAGATETECARLRTDEVSVRDDGQVCVQVGGGRGHTCRVIALAPGSEDAIRDLLDFSSDGYLIPVDTDDVEGPRPETIDKMLRRLLASTGLEKDPAATVASIRNTGLRVIYDRFGLETTAEVAGTASLQTLREELGLIGHKPRRRQTRS